jgi:hypothetical protein
MLIEGVYSWRTGKNAVSDPPASPPVKGDRRDQFGIQTPTRSGTLLDRLAERKQYLEDFQRAAFPAETQSGSTSVNRVSTTDSGHRFATHKTFRSPYRGTVRGLGFTPTNPGYSGDIWCFSDTALYNPSSYTFGFTTVSTGGLLSVTNADRQGMANRYFALTAPDRKVGSLMTTLVELIRGDIPSLLKNFREMMAGLKSIRNMIGSDALNITFGWTPLIQEYANIINVGMNLERIIYYESFRRKRSWDGPVMTSSRDSTQTFHYLTTPYTDTTVFVEPGDVKGPPSGPSVDYYSHRDTVETEDYHWSSKYTGLAKASRRADDFSNQAMDIFKRLGLVDDPQLLWDLTPYSWLVDWFTTMGDSIANANTYAPLNGKYSVDYAYLTTQRIRKTDSYITRRTGGGSPFKFISISHPKSFGYSTTRWRERATPFGFGTQLGSLSASQFGILTALGLARSR